MSATSSLCRMPMKAWPGVRLAVTSAPSAFCFTALDEGLDHRQRDVGLEQRHAHLAQGLGDVVFGDAAAAAQGVDRARQAGGQVFEKCHGARIILCYGAYAKRPLLILGIALVVLLLLIAFSSGTEVAMLSANRYKIRAAAKAGKRTAKALDACSQARSWLGANLVILALASVAASSIATLLAQRTGYEHAIPVAMAVLAVVHDRVLRARAEDLRGAEARSGGAELHLHLQGAGVRDDAVQLVHQQGGVRIPAAVRREARERARPGHVAPTNCARWSPRPAR